jgi:hypothetical protein
VEYTLRSASSPWFAYRVASSGCADSLRIEYTCRLFKENKFEATEAFPIGANRGWLNIMVSGAQEVATAYRSWPSALSARSGCAE